MDYTKNDEMMYTDTKIFYQENRDSLYNPDFQGVKLLTGHLCLKPKDFVLDFAIGRPYVFRFRTKSRYNVLIVQTGGANSKNCFR